MRCTGEPSVANGYDRSPSHTESPTSVVRHWGEVVAICAMVVGTTRTECRSKTSGFNLFLTQFPTRNMSLLELLTKEGSSLCDIGSIATTGTGPVEVNGACASA